MKARHVHVHVQYSRSRVRVHPEQLEGGDVDVSMRRSASTNGLARLSSVLYVVEASGML